MPRAPRLLTEGRIYYVYNRFARGEALFDGGWKSGRFLEMIEKTKKKDGFAVLLDELDQLLASNTAGWPT